jgi:hypothetical protein
VIHLSPIPVRRGSRGRVLACASNGGLANFRPMKTPLIRRLTKTRARAAKLERSIATELASLPAAYGFDSHVAFIAALRAAGRGAGRGSKRARTLAAPKARKRAVITNSIRSRVKDLFKAGKSGSRIAKAVGISLPSVQNIKKAFGLVKARKRPAAKPKARRVPIKRAAVPMVQKKRVSPRKATGPEAKPASTTVVPPAAPAV